MARRPRPFDHDAPTAREKRLAKTLAAMKSLDEPLSPRAKRALVVFFDGMPVSAAKAAQHGLGWLRLPNVSKVTLGELSAWTAQHGYPMSDEFSWASSAASLPPLPVDLAHLDYR